MTGRSFTQGLWVGAVMAAFLAAVLALATGGWRWSTGAVETQAATPDLRAISALGEDVEVAAAVAAEACYLGAIVAREAIDVAAEIDGVLESLDVRLGDRVAAGQVIASLDTRSLRHQLDTERANLKSAEAQERRFAIEAERTADEHDRRVALSGLLSREDEEKARFQHESAKASLEEAAAERSRVAARIAGLRDDIERSRLRAPFAGSVALRYLDAGARVSAGTPIVHLLGSEDLLVRFAVPPEAAHELEVSTPLRVETLESRHTFAATVEHMAPEIDPASLMLILEARLEAPAEVDVPFGSEVRVSAASADAPSCVPDRVG